MDSAKIEAAVKTEPKEEDDSIKIEEQLFVIDQKFEKKPELATVRPLSVPVNDFNSHLAEPSPSTSRVVAEVRFHNPTPAPFKFEDDPFDLGPRARLSPPPPPAERAKRRSVPGGHASAKPRLKFAPYQARR